MYRRTVLRGLTTLSVAAGVSGIATRGRASASFGPTGSVTIEGVTEGVVDESGSIVYVATGDGFAVVDIADPANPSVVAENRSVLDDRENGPLTGIADVKVSGDRLLVVGPKGVPRENMLSGFVLYDVSDPTSPKRVAARETAHGIHNAYLDGDTAYLTGTNDRQPLVIYDVSDDDPAEVTRWSVVDADANWLDVNPYVRQCHDVFVRDDTAYVAFWDAGTWLLDVADPANPSVQAHVGGRDPGTIASSDNETYTEILETPGNSHYVAPNEDASLLAVGREAWDVKETERTGGPGGITLWDISDVSSPTELTTIAPPETNDATRDGVMTTSHNFGWRGDRLYTSWYRGGVRVFDVGTPSRPKRLAAWESRETTGFWTARPSADGFVATSRHDPSRPDEEVKAGAGLFTFPEPSSENAVPVGTVTTSTTPTTAEPTETTGTRSTTADAETSTTTDASTGQSGFGLTATLVGGGLGALRLLRKRS